MIKVLSLESKKSTEVQKNMYIKTFVEKNFRIKLQVQKNYK